MDKPNVVVIGASAGGVEALIELFSRLAAPLDAAFFVVIHLPPNGSSALPSILERKGRMPVCEPRDGVSFRPGCVYVAPPDAHMMLRDGVIYLVRGPKENGSRPAIDPLFRSASLLGRRVIGVILSGLLDDGTQGMAAIKEAGGITVAQDPDEALHPSMPLSAITSVGVHYVLPVAGIAELIEKLTTGGTESVTQNHKADGTPMSQTQKQDALEPTGLTCPDCGGVIWERSGGAKPWYKCRVGHAFSEGAMESRQAETVEAALWKAARLLDEKAALARRIATRLRKRNNVAVAVRFEGKAAESKAAAEVLRSLLARPQEAEAEHLVMVKEGQ